MRPKTKKNRRLKVLHLLRINLNYIILIILKKKATSIKRCQMYG